MTRRIHILPDSVANQIAAGEVVERPASVVKELVENSLDAGATSVNVLVEAGGKQRIRVSDDGIGMSREDALLSLDRHATSKISKASDLTRIGTFGFRGEALPSIAAVSRMALETMVAAEAVGTEIRVEGGRILYVKDLARQPGTTVDVRALFFNAPARRQFLKSASGETRAVSEALSTLALANPSVAFRLESGGRSLLSVSPAPSLAARIGDLWGEEEAATLIPVSAEGPGLGLRGLIQRPDAAQPGFRRAYLFANTRPFRESKLLKAAERGYRTTLAAGQRPWIFLYLTVEGGALDVNVHPAKLEVRFRDLPAVEALVERGVRDALSGVESGATLDSQLTARPIEVREPPTDFGREGPPPSSQMALFVARDPEEPEETDEADDGQPVSEGWAEADRPRLWQIHDTYILAEVRDGLLLIDQHSAHERVLFQRLMSAFEEAGQESQRLLFPLTIRLPAPEARQVREIQSLLGRIGFEVEDFGGDTVIVHSVPNPHPYFDAERCFREMIGELTEGSELVRSARNQHERIAMTFACKGAIKAGQRLEAREMAELFDALFSTDLPFHDVHGRPTIVRLTKAELERKFGR
jgi:DNA mismatch repair protein MutL